ncbi:MAG: hypothetical protein K0Q79_864 [Flavipsychrobacter sp.]|jgi:hypothetical protein|nr:hypothetical protein [Flavipsychrobacter sp.]
MGFRGIVNGARNRFMKKFLAIVSIIFLTSITAIAQRSEHKERIHAAKMAYIIDRLNLTSQQSSHFIPLYNDFENEVRDMRHNVFRKYKGTDLRDADDETSRQFIDDNLDYQQQVIDIKRKYNDQFLKIISPQQVAELHKAEREFKQMLIKRLENRQHRQGPGGRFNGRRGGY